MFKKPALIFLWFIATPLVLATSVLSLSTFNKTGKLDFAADFSSFEVTATTSLDPQVLGVQVNDLRPHIVENFLKGTTLASYSNYIVEVSDKYGLDFRLIPAIAMKESGGGDAVRSNSFNAWGFGNGRSNFNSWEEAIDIVGKTLKEKYVDRGLVTPEQIMPVYAPPQIETGGKWAQDINFFFLKMENL